MLGATASQRDCFGWSPQSALERRFLFREACGRTGSFGPFPFVTGPLQIMSEALRAWVAPRLSPPDPRHDVKYEVLATAS